MTSALPSMFVMAKPTAVEQPGQHSGYLSSPGLIGAVIDAVSGRHIAASEEMLEAAMAEHGVSMMGAAFLVLAGLSQYRPACCGYACLAPAEPAFYRIFYPDHDPAGTSNRAVAIHQNNTGWVHVDAIACGHRPAAGRACVPCLRDILGLKTAFRAAVLAAVPHVSRAGERDNLVHTPETPRELADQWAYLSGRLMRTGPLADPTAPRGGQHRA